MAKNVKSKERPAEETAAQPHRHTYTMWAIGVMVAICIGAVGWFKASAQTTTNNGNGVAVGTNSGTINAGSYSSDHNFFAGGPQSKLQLTVKTPGDATLTSNIFGTEQTKVEIEGGKSATVDRNVFDALAKPDR
jgi:hypothetical protein